MEYSDEQLRQMYRDIMDRWGRGKKDEYDSGVLYGIAGTLRQRGYELNADKSDWVKTDKPSDDQANKVKD